MEIVGQDLSDPSNILKDRYEGITTNISSDESKSSPVVSKTTLVHDLVVIRRSIPSFSSSSSSTTLYTTVFFVLSWITPAFGIICIGLGIMYALARRHALTSLRGAKANRARANTNASTTTTSYPSEEKMIIEWLRGVPSEVRRGMAFVSPFIRVLSLCVEYVERLTTGDDTKRLYRVLYVVIVEILLCCCSLSLSLSVCFSLSLSFSLSLCFSLSLPLSLSLTLSLPLHLPLSLVRSNNPKSESNHALERRYLLGCGVSVLTLYEVMLLLRNWFGIWYQ